MKEIKIVALHLLKNSWSVAYVTVGAKVPTQTGKSSLHVRKREIKPQSAYSSVALWAPSQQIIPIIQNINLKQKEIKILRADKQEKITCKLTASWNSPAQGWATEISFCFDSQHQTLGFAAF